MNFEFAGTPAFSATIEKQKADHFSVTGPSPSRQRLAAL